MLSIIPIILFMTNALLFIGAVFDIDWIMKMTRADRRYGRDFARTIWSVVGFLGIIAAIVALFQ